MEALLPRKQPCPSNQKIHKVIDELVYNVLAKTSLAAELCARWMHSPDELVGRAGWNLLIARILRRGTARLDFDAILKSKSCRLPNANRSR
jgi:hypothetical protein